LLSSFDEKAGILNWFGVTSDEFKQHIKFKREIGLEASSAGGIKFLFSNLRKNTILFQITTKTKNIASNILSPLDI